MIEKAADSFLAVVDPAKTKVIAFPEYVAVFGGPISGKKSRAKHPKSQRDAFLRWVRDNRAELEPYLILPENYEDWNHFDTYSDLVLFERDLSVLTNAILLFVESPGAIAELGAFSQIKTLSERLVIVVTENHHPKKSFISLGPIRSVAETQKHRSSVCHIPNVKLADLTEYLPVVMDTLDEKRKPKQATTSFDVEEPQHQVLLILDFINLFIATTITELKSLAGGLGVDLTTKRLHQILFALKKTGLVVGRRYGDPEYLVANKFKNTYIDFTAKTGIDAFNRERFKAKRWREIEADYNRKAAYKLANKEAM